MALLQQTSQPTLSGERFTAIYRITVANDPTSKEEALAKAKDITLEQTVEFPEELVPRGVIQEQILGRIEHFFATDPNDDSSRMSHFLAEISFATELAGGEITQLLNVLFGNISLKPGIRLEEIRLSPSLGDLFPGPRFGQTGLRNLFKEQSLPLLCTALKPQGLSATDLAAMASQFAEGGIHIIKDDHGLANQPFATFEERLHAITKTVQQTNQRCGTKAVYAPNVTADFTQMIRRARLAREAGAGALLISPGLCGFSAMAAIAADDTIGLPILAHPAMLGSFVVSPDHGLSHSFLFGQLMRLCGADASIFPNYGGRFSFTREECKQIASGCSSALAKNSVDSYKPIFPAPGGGMTMDRLPDLRQMYGNEVMFLIGGGLFRHSNDLTENARYFRHLIEESYKTL